MGSRTLAILAALTLAVPLAGCAGITSREVAYGETWTHEMIQADLLRERGLSGKGVRVAIVDTGIDLDHPEFKGITIKWADVVNRRAEAYDDNGHGTHVASIIAAQGDWNTMFSGFRLRGIAPAVELIIIKAMDKDGNGDEDRVAQAINTAVAQGADIVVLSLGGKTAAIFGTNIETAVKSAVQKGVFVVAAAGNKQDGENDCIVASPASVEGVIAVGAIDRNEVIGDFSCHGTGKEGSGSLAPGIPSPITGSRDPHKKPEVVAPGVEILSAWKDGGYASAHGTSQAAPAVGGILALILESKPALKEGGAERIDQVKVKLQSTSKKVGPLQNRGPAAHDDRYGYGIIQGDALLRALG